MQPHQFISHLMLAGFVCLANRGLSATPDDPPVQAKSNSVRLALMRAVPKQWDLDGNFKVYLDAVNLAAQSKANVLITPECWLDGYASAATDSTPEKIHAIAQPLETSPYLERVSQQAKAHRIFVCFGFTSLEGGRPYDAAGLWGPDGKRIGIYHKTHLQKHDLQYAFGESLPVWPTAWGSMGVMICADRRWPETARVLRLQGARLILNPSYGFYGDLNEAMMRTRAYENQCFIAFAHPKQSLVTGPTGKVLAKEETKDDNVTAARITICDLDLSQAKDDNHLQDRRPEIYRLIPSGPSAVERQPK